jgi:hypothetical protein
LASSIPTQYYLFNLLILKVILLLRAGLERSASRQNGLFGPNSKPKGENRKWGVGVRRNSLKQKGKKGVREDS